MFIGHLLGEVKGGDVCDSASFILLSTECSYVFVFLWKKDRRIIVARVLKEKKESAQLSFLAGEEYQYFFYVTNTELSSEEVVDFYQKRGNCENYIKEAKYETAVGHLLLQSFWSNEAIFQLMMLAYNLFLLLKIDFLETTEYWQQIKTFRLKYIFLAGKIVRTARSVVMKLSVKYPYREIYEKKSVLKRIFVCTIPLFIFKLTSKKHFMYASLLNGARFGRID